MSSASDLNKIAQETYHAISQQDRETYAIASSVEEMSTNATEIANNGDTVKDAATIARTKTDEGSRVVENNLEGPAARQRHYKRR